MPRVIRNGEVVEDAWKFAPADAEPSAVADQTFVPVKLWLEARDALAGKAIGLLFEPDDEVESVADAARDFERIAVSFPDFNDGRGYSTAHLLRTRYGYSGELCAVGDVLRDQLHYMKRCGIDAFVVRDDTDIDAAREGLEVYSAYYQGSATDPDPVFRRS